MHFSQPNTASILPVWDFWVTGQHLWATKPTDMGFSLLSSRSNLAGNRPSLHFARVASRSGPLTGHSRPGWDGVVEQRVQLGSQD